MTCGTCGRELDPRCLNPECGPCRHRRKFPSWPVVKPVLEPAEIDEYRIEWRTVSRVALVNMKRARRKGVGRA